MLVTTKRGPKTCLETAVLIQTNLVKPVFSIEDTEYFALLSISNHSSRVSNLNFGQTTTVLRSLGSKQILILLGVVTTTILLIQSVGIATFSKIPFLSRLSSLAFTLPVSQGNWHTPGNMLHWFDSGSVMTIWSPIWPDPSETSL